MTSKPLEPMGGDETSLTPRPLKARLCVMMFLQYFVQGCYLPIASLYVEKTLGFSSREVGIFGSALAVGPLFAPFILGQLVDRHFATQRVVAFCHLVAGVLMIALYLQKGIWPVVILGTIYSVMYVPTMMLTNALAFRHLRNRDKEFPIVRLFGTIGFVVPALLIEFGWLRNVEGEALDTARGIAFLLAGVMGLVMGIYCLTLPHTPPEKKKERNYAPGTVIGLLQYRHFLVLVIISFLIAIVHKFYFVWNSPFLRAVLDSGNIGGAYEQSISAVGQAFEVIVMAGLGFGIARYGFKATMLVGTLAYLARCLVFACVFGFDVPFASRMALAISGQALHGFCFGCFLAAAYMYVDRVAPRDVRGSMQTLYGTFVIALGFFFGGFIGGSVGEAFTTKLAKPTIRDHFGIEATAGLVEFKNKAGELFIRDWPGIWLSCAALAAVCVIGFVIFFPKDVDGSDDLADKVAGKPGKAE